MNWKVGFENFKTYYSNPMTKNLFYTNVYSIQCPSAIQSRGLLKEVVWVVRGKKCNLWGYMGKIMIKLRLEKV